MLPKGTQHLAKMNVQPQQHPSQQQQQQHPKSTPIHQLPPFQQHQQQQQSSFINDQHRQIVSQAQDAVSNFSLPTNSQMQSDIQEDDVTIREVLQQIGGSQQQGQPLQQQQSAPPLPPPVQQAIQQAPGPTQWLAPSQTQHQQISEDVFMLPYMAVQQQQQGLLQSSPQQQGLLNRLLFSSEARSAWLVAALYVVVALLPVDAVLGRYAAVTDRFPHAALALRAALLALAFFATNALLASSSPL